MGTTIGGALDYLLTSTNTVTGTTLVTDLRVVDPNVVLVDNEPESTSRSLVIIGRRNYESADSAQTQAVNLVLGAGRIQEDYLIHGYIQTLRDGPAQKPARDAAIALWDAVLHWVHADLTLGGLLLQGRSVTDINFNLIQTETDADTAGGSMRFAEIDFSFRVLNHYIP